MELFGIKLYKQGLHRCPDCKALLDSSMNSSLDMILQEPVVLCTMLSTAHVSQLLSLDGVWHYLILPRSSCTMLCKRLLSKASLV